MVLVKSKAVNKAGNKTGRPPNVFEFHDAQKAIVNDKHRFRVVNCGRRLGKTTLAVYEMLGRAYSKECSVAYIAPTFQQARDIAWKELKKVCLPVTVNANESRLEITVQNQAGTRSTIILRGWEAIETLRGQHFALVVIDEVASMRDFWTGWEDVIRPTLTDDVGDVLFISTPKGFNHFYDLYNMEGKHPDTWKSFHFTSYDNPHLTIEELNNAKNEMPEDKFAQEYMADFRKHEKLVYREFDRKIHVVDEMPQNIIETLVGIDFGFTNPAAVIKVVRDFDNNFIVASEWYKVGQTEQKIAEYAMTLNANAYYPDPENPSAIDVLKNKGMPIHDVVKGKDSVVNGIDKVRHLLHNRKLKIHRSCINLISEMEAYSYPEEIKSNRNLSEPEKPVKGFDHALDALRYVIMMSANVVINPKEDTNWNLYVADYS